MIKQIILALFTGIMLIFFIAQHDKWVQYKIGQAFKEVFEESFDCSISFVVREINFFSPQLMLEQVVVVPRDGKEWQWHCNRYVTTFNWGHLFNRGSIDIAVIMDGLAMSSVIVDNSLAIAPHLEKIMQVPSLPIPAFLKSLMLKGATFHVIDKTETLAGTLQWHSSSVKIGDLFKSTMYIIGGQLAVHNKTMITAPTGNLKIDVDTAKDAKTVVHIDSSFELVHLGEYNTCYLTGVWDHNNGRFALRSAHDLCAIDPIIITKRDKDTYLRLMARLPLSYLWCFLTDDIANNCVGGNGFLSVQATFGASPRIDGQLIFEDVQYKQRLLCDISKIFFAKRNDAWHGGITLRSHTAEFNGSWHWLEQARTGGFDLSNINTIAIPHTKRWQLLPHDFLCQVKVDESGAIDGSYQATATNTVRNTTNKIVGTMRIKDDAINVAGMINEERYLVEGELQPKIRLKKCSYFAKDETPLISLVGKSNHNNAIDGSITFSFIRSLLQQCLGYDLQGQGVAQVRGMVDSNRIIADLHFTDTTIRLPQTYNFIDGLDVSICYDMTNHKLLFHDIYCSLYAGTIRSSRAVLLFDFQGNCRFAHVPLLFDRCLLNVKKDLFASVSGNILFSHVTAEQPLVKGHFIIDRAQLKENLFSDSFQKQLINYTGRMFTQPDINMACDLSIETRSPIRVDTAFLKTDAKVKLQIQRTVNNPEVTGTINLLSGSLGFPYKPLYITKGSIYFLPNQLYDPHIELVAKNKIKKYNIGMQVTGSLHAHHVLFDSSPPLTDEQVIGLLLIGSEQESMPALSIMQNVQQVIFGTNQSLLVREYFKPLLGPFSSISLIPRFSDQSGRGGLRGALEIEVNDRMRVLIQKNFSLTEDTKFELEYLFSDDITLRAIRDERRDIGGEVELRWKF